MLTSDYKNLKVWQKAMELTLAVYELIKYLPREENYRLSDQMRRAVVSIPSNIAEGHGRNSNKEFVQFLSIARGSLLEIDTQLEICERLGYLESAQIDKAKNLITEIGKMLNSLISYRINLTSKP